MFHSSLLFRTLFSDTPIRRQLFLILIIQFVNLISAQSIGDYYQNGGFYSHSNPSSAEAECQTFGKTLCSSEQLFRVVFQDVDGQSFSNLCFNAYTSDDSGSYQYGWFNNDENAEQRCRTNWMPSWAVTMGAHCCSDFEGTSFSTCSSYSCTGTNQPKENIDDLLCVGDCDDATCCDDWSEAPLFSNIGGYEYSSLDEAESACQAAQSDYTICTYDQLVGLAESGSRVCSSGWYKTLDADGNVVGTRGWYVSEEAAADNYCGGVAGDRLWQRADGLGSAHCCVPSYANDGYGVLTEQSVEAAEEYCSSRTYQNTLCSQAQLQTIAQVEAPGICTSGWVNDALVGWYQTDETACGGVTGWRAWASPIATAHCCTSYVQAYESVSDYGFTPASYGASTFTSGALAEAACIDAGYDALCSQGQVAWVGTNLEQDLCKVGWAKTAIGSSEYVTPGYYNTITPSGRAGCGKTETWNDVWQPTNPVAHCCLNTVEEIELTQVPYYNGGWGTYTMSSMAEAAAQCTGDYQLCSKDQVYQIATIGYDGFVDSNICKHGWVSDNEIGWYQVDEGCSTANAWNSLNNPLGTWHCCLPFEPTVTLEETATLLPAFTRADAGYTLQDADEALAACQALSADYDLCSDAQVAEAAINGVAGDGETWESVDPNGNFCYSGYVGSSICDDANEYGWYSVDGGCGGSANSWVTWKAAGGSDAWCCANTMTVSADYSDVLGCPATTESPETEAPETESPETEAPETEAPTTEDPAPPVKLNVEDGDCIGTVNSFNTQCQVLTNQADCESEGTDQFATGVCDWIPAPTTTAPVVKEPSLNPSTSPVSFICDYYMIKVPSVDTDDEDFVKDFVGVYAKMDDEFSKFYKPTQYSREYDPANDATVHVTAETTSIDIPTSTTADGFVAVVAVSPAGLLDPNGVTVSYFGTSSGSVTATFSCTTEPPLQKYRDADAAAIASVGIVKLANEVYANIPTIPDGSSDAEAALANRIIEQIEATRPALLAFIDLLSDGHIKAECQAVFAGLIDDTGSIDSDAMTAFSNGATLNGCAPAGFDVDADLDPTNELWGTCRGTNVYSNQGALCGIWTLIFGITVNRPNAQTENGAAETVNTINDFMGYFIGDYIKFVFHLFYFLFPLNLVNHCG